MAFAVAIFSLALASSCDLFVSYGTGSDRASGTSIDAPLKTIHSALNASTHRSTPSTICLRSGAPHLLGNEPLYIDAKVSSLPSAPLTIQGYGPDIAAGKGRPVISGGVTVGPFVPDAIASARLGVTGRAVNVWSAPIPTGVTDRPTVMWREDGSWLQRARHPQRSPLDERSRHMGVASTMRWTKPLAPENADKSWPAQNKLGFEVNASDFAWLPAGGLHRLNEVQVLHFHAWTAFWSDVQSIDIGTSGAAKSTLMFASPANVFVGQYAKQGGQRFLLENVREALDEEGEWYWDEGAAKVYLVPSAAERSANANAPLFATAPAGAKMAAMMVVSGEGSGFTLRDVEVKHGAVGDRVNTYYTRSAAVSLFGGANVTLERVRISSSGGNGVLVGQDFSGVALLDSAAEQLGADGFATMSAKNVSDLTVNNSFFNSTARVIMGQPGAIRLKGEARLVATHNTIGFQPYAGIMLGWQDGLTRSASAARVAAHDELFTVTHNVVHDFGLGILSDFGGIYFSAGANCISGGSTRAAEPTCWLPSTVEYNAVRNATSFDYGGSGIYMDEQASGVSMERNVLWNTADSSVYFHCGADNSFVNNVCGRAATAKPNLNDKILPKLCNAGGNPTWPNMNGVLGFRFERNIVLVDTESSISVAVDASHSDVRNGSMVGNLYWSSSAATVAALQRGAIWPNVSASVETGRAKGVDWAAWEAPPSSAVHTGTSAIADPLFSDDWTRDLPQRFALEVNSPAIRMGFVPFDATAAGCDASLNPYCAA